MVQRYENRSVLRGLDILEAVSDSTSASGAREIAKKVDLSAATTFRHLQVLEQAGYLLKTSDDKYLPGFMLFRLGHRQKFMKTVKHLIEPHLRALAFEFNATAHAATLEGSQVAFVLKVQSNPNLQIFTKQGMRLDAHTTALGKAMLAFQGENTVTKLFEHRPIARHTANSVTNLASLQKQLISVRRDQVAMDNEESALGLQCVASPIINTFGTANIAISICMHSHDITAATLRKLQLRLPQVARDITNILVNRKLSN